MVLRGEHMRIWKSDGSSASSLVDALSIRKDNIAKGSKTDCCVISVIGGGGKTSLLYCLSRELSSAGFRVALTTSTHMMIPVAFPWTDRIDEAVRMLASGPVLVASKISLKAKHGGVDKPGGIPSETVSVDTEKERDYITSLTVGRNEEDVYNPVANEKCGALSEEDYGVLRREADIILVEADGARQLPLKAEEAHEPAIMPDSDYVIAVAGIDAVGRPLREICHRPWLVADRYGLSLDAKVTGGLAARLLTDPVIGQMKWLGADLPGQNMRRQFRILINKADDAGRRESAFDICRLLSGQGIISAVTALRDRVALIVLAAGQSRRFLCCQAGQGKEAAEAGAERHVSEDGHLDPASAVSSYEQDCVKKEPQSKLEHYVGGEPLFAGLLRAVRELTDKYGDAVIHEKILVTQEARRELRRAAEADGFKIAINQHPERGISSSIKLGISAVGDSEAYLFTVCDQPKLTGTTFYRLTEAYHYGGASIAAVKPDVYSAESGPEGKKSAGGSPNIFSCRYRDELMSLEGDKGGKRVIRKHEDDTVYIEVPAEELYDVDTPEDLRNL
jgi:probable selenium-dependent hydroxylase accessory protein YqeC